LQQAQGAILTPVQGGVPLDPRVGAALQLLDLNTISIMREATHDTKLLLASGPSAIVLSFRGTASAAAAWADLQVGSVYEAGSGAGKYWPHILKRCCAMEQC
jgi:hypothetical protein